jgi:hypothetical protein
MPRKVDPNAPKRPVGRPKGSTKAAKLFGPAQPPAAGPAAAAFPPAAGLPLAPPSSAAKHPALTPYPDLALAIAMLERRLAHVGATRAQLIERWLVSLKKIHADITRLRRLEVLSDDLTATTNKPRF